jgi:hypothetical protein
MQWQLFLLMFVLFFGHSGAATYLLSLCSAEQPTAAVGYLMPSFH